MNSGALKRTLVADLQYDPKFSDCKEKLFPIISRSTINLTVFHNGNLQQDQINTGKMLKFECQFL